MPAKIIRDLSGVDQYIKELQKYLAEGNALIITREALESADTNSLFALSSMIDRVIVDDKYLELVKHFRNQPEPFYKELKVEGFNRVYTIDAMNNYVFIYRYEIQKLIMEKAVNHTITEEINISPYLNGIKALKVVNAKLNGALNLVSDYDFGYSTRRFEYLADGKVKARDKATAEVEEKTYAYKRTQVQIIFKIKCNSLTRNDVNDLYHKYKGNYIIVLNGKEMLRPAKVEKVQAHLDEPIKTYNDSALAAYINRKAVALWLANKGFVKVDEEEYKITIDIVKDFFPLSLTNDTLNNTIDKLMVEFKLTVDTKRLAALEVVLQDEGRFIQVTSLNKSNKEGKELVDQVPDPSTEENK